MSYDYKILDRIINTGSVVLDYIKKRLYPSVATQPIFLTAALNRLSENERIRALLAQDRNGDTVVHLAADNPACLTIILQALPNIDERLELLRTANYDSLTVWHILAKLDQPDCVTLLANTLPAVMLLTALLQIDADGQTAFNVAANENLDCLAIMLNVLPFDLRLSALLTSNHAGDNSLHLAARHMDAACLALMLNSLPHDLRLQPLMANNDYGETVMLLVLERFDEASLITIMNGLLEEQRLVMVLQEKDKNDQCFLQQAVSYGRKDLLSLLLN